MLTLTHRQKNPGEMRDSIAVIVTVLVAVTSTGCETLGITDASTRGVYGDVIFRDTTTGFTCGVNGIDVTVTGGSFSATDVTMAVSGDLATYGDGYWTLSDVPVSTSMTLTARDPQSDFEPASKTFTVPQVSGSPPAAFDSGELRVFARPGTSCSCDPSGLFC